MHFQLLTRVLLLLVQFGILAVALPNIGISNVEKTLAEAATDMVDNMLESSEPSESSTTTTTKSEKMPAAAPAAAGGSDAIEEKCAAARFGGVARPEEQPKKRTAPKRPALVLRRSSSWSGEKVVFGGTLKSGRWLGQ